MVVYHPSVFHCEHFGLWGSHAHKFLSHISRQSYNTTHAHPFNSARFKVCLMQRQSDFEEAVEIFMQYKRQWHNV